MSNLSSSSFGLDAFDDFDFSGSSSKKGSNTTVGTIVDSFLDQPGHPEHRCSRNLEIRDFTRCSWTPMFTRCSLGVQEHRCSIGVHSVFTRCSKTTKFFWVRPPTLSTPTRNYSKKNTPEYSMTLKLITNTYCVGLGKILLHFLTKNFSLS